MLTMTRPCQLTPPKMLSWGEAGRAMVWVLPTEALAQSFIGFLWKEAMLVPASSYALDETEHVIRVEYPVAKLEFVCFACYLLAELHARQLHLNQCLEAEDAD